MTEVLCSAELEALRLRVQAMTLEEIDGVLEDLGAAVTILKPGVPQVLPLTYPESDPNPTAWGCGPPCTQGAIRHAHWRDLAGNAWSCEKHWRETWERDLPRLMFMRQYDLLGNENAKASLATQGIKWFWGELDGKPREAIAGVVPA